MAVKLGLAGEDVTVIARGPKLEAIRKNGFKLIWEDGTEHVAKVGATDKIGEVGPQDVVILAVKAHHLDQVAREMPSLVGDDTMIVTVQNGIPWWYFHRHGGEFENHRLETLDPDGVLEKNIDGDMIIGCVAYPAATVDAPGIIHHVEGDRFPVGELDGSESERVQALHDVLVNAGLRSRVLDDIRSEIWLKAWGNLSFNPISALTHATLEEICRTPDTRKLAEAMMRESQDIAEKLGVTFRHTIEKRIAGAENVGAHKTSMLQDVEVGRSLEFEALIGAVLELGKLTETPSPSIAAVYACVKLLNRVLIREGTGIGIHAAA